MSAPPVPLDVLHKYYRNKAEIDRIASKQGKSLQDDIYKCLRRNLRPDPPGAVVRGDPGDDEYSSGDYSDLVAEFNGLGVLNDIYDNKGKITHEMTDLYNEYIGMLPVQGPAMQVDPSMQLDLALDQAENMQVAEAVEQVPGEDAEGRGAKRGRETSPAGESFPSSRAVINNAKANKKENRFKELDKYKRIRRELELRVSDIADARRVALKESRKVQNEDGEEDYENTRYEEENAMIEGDRGGTKGKKRRYTRKKRR
jgi:hypothetical protein